MIPSANVEVTRLNVPVNMAIVGARADVPGRPRQSAVVEVTRTIVRAGLSVAHVLVILTGKRQRAKIQSANTQVVRMVVLVLTPNCDLAVSRDCGLSLYLYSSTLADSISHFYPLST